MINIISERFRLKNVDGPYKVLYNTLLGFDKLGIEYRSNPILYDKAWCHDSFSKQLDNSNSIFGPNLMFNSYKNVNFKYILVPCNHMLQQHSIQSANFFSKDKIKVWASGIDTDKFEDYSDANKTLDCIIYFKRRNISELKRARDFLKSKKQSHVVVSYGSYREEDLMKLCQRARYVFLLDNTESQGIALQEMMSCGLPVFAWDYKTFFQGVKKTSLPWFDDRCGIRDSNLSKLISRFDEFISNLGKYKPREYIVENFDLVQQAQKLIDLYNE